MIRARDGRSEGFGSEAGQEVLYENTGYSKYFATSFPTDISGYESWRDFEKTDFDEIEQDKGASRVNRVYRQLAVCPAMYWDGNEDADGLYLKNQHQWVARYLQQNLGGNLDIYRNMACLTLDESDCYGAVHPRDAMLPEAVLLICARIQDELTKEKLKKAENECIYISKEKFSELVRNCREEWKKGWSKEFREMEEAKLIETVRVYMENWMLIRCEQDQVVILPAAGRLAGFYPKDFEGGTEE